MSRPILVLLSVLALVALAFAILCRPAPRLPIYRVATPAVTPASVIALAGTLLPSGTMPPGGTLSETADRFVLRSGTARFEVYKVSGGVWFEDSTQLWNPDLTPVLPDSSALVAHVARMSNRGPADATRLSNDSTFTSFEVGTLRPTFVTTLDGPSGVTSTVQLDWHMPIAANVAEPRPGARRFPVTGGGGEFEFHFGDHGRVVGASGVWREIQGIVRREPLVPRAVADQEFRRRVGGAGVVVFQPPRLAYYSAPAPVEQDSLMPVYLYSGVQIVSGDSIPLPVEAIPATRLDGQATGPPPAALRSTTSPPPPRPGSTDPEGPEEGGTGSAAGPGTAWREVGASWLGAVGGDTDAEANVTGLLEALSADGWTVNFNWGNADAWYGDWSADRAQWVDAADLVFYTGHASLNGWKLFDPEFGTAAEPRFKTLSALTSVATNVTPGGLYGAGDLEWIVIAACGPLEDRRLSRGGGNALERWKGAFGGLHLLLGYGSVTFDNALEGRLLAKYALEGATLVDAWFRAAEESQPPENNADPPYGPSIWAGAMWAEKSGETSPVSDHLWGHGSVAPDPRNPDRWRIIWSPT